MLNVHDPVLEEEIKEIFSIGKFSVFVDGTIGAGGHSKMILENCLEKDGILVGFDQDFEILKIAKEKLKAFKDRIILINKNFIFLKEELLKHDITSVDGILLDLGVSSYQLDSQKRGFSFRYDAPLDMRMDIRSSLTAYEIVNTYSENKLKELFKKSEVKNFNQAVKKIINVRKNKVIRTTKELSNLFLSPNYKGNKRIHPATLIFQALRMEVNKELDVLTEGLKRSFDMLHKGGILAVISFHSLEDRIVKTFFKKKSMQCVCPKELPKCICSNMREAKIITNKPIIPKKSEINFNVRARSAKLRILCKEI